MHWAEHTKVSKDIHGLYQGTCHDYLNTEAFFSDLIADFPSLNALKKKINHKTFCDQKRQRLYLSLRKQYALCDLTPPKSLELLKNSNTFTICSGHQLCVALGPLYMIYKIVSSIALCEKLKEEFPEKNIVPVFWMASEDHDRDEIQSVYFNGQYFKWNTQQEGAVGRFNLNDINPFITQITENISGQPFAEDLKKLLTKAYRKENNLSQATRTILHELFASYGLLCLDADDHTLKDSFCSIIQDELTSNKSQEYLQKSITLFENQGYKAQIQKKDTGFFILQKNKRLRLDRENQDFKIKGQPGIFSLSEIIKQSQKNPEIFSPNVSLRPLYQEFLLPNIATFCGPSELSYWLLLKPVFDAHKVDFPLLMARDSFLMLRPKTISKIKKNTLNIPDLFQDKDVVINALLKQKPKLNIQKDKDALHLKFNTLLSSLKKNYQGFEQFSQAEKKKFANQLNYIEKKIEKAHRNIHRQHIEQIDSVYHEVFPNGVFQERIQNFIPYYALYGDAFIKHLVASAAPLSNDLNLVYLP